MEKALGLIFEKRPIMNDDEIFVIKSAQNGDEDAWHKLFNWHFKGVYSYCLNLTSGEHGLAEDITQQVFITAARIIRRFEPKRSTFRAWLFGVARKIFMKQRSQEIKRKWYKAQFFKKQCIGKEYPKELVVHEVLAQLPLHYCNVLESKYLENLTVKEIASIYGCSAKAVESLLIRAKKKFEYVYCHTRKAE